jgi:hypothetical protein
MAKSIVTPIRAQSIPPTESPEQPADTAAETFASWLALYKQVPFAGSTAKPTWWNLPATGGYGGECQAGQAAATAYLKYLREMVELEYRNDHGVLQNIVLDMLEANGVDLGHHPDSRPGDSLRGQIVSFFSQLDQCLASEVSFCPRLDGLSFETLGADMHAGLARTAEDDAAE